MKCCSRCGKRLPANKPRVYSTFNHVYYCADIDACTKRARRARRREAVAA